MNNLETLLFILLFLSGCVIIYLIQKIQDVSNLSNAIDDVLESGCLDRWDRDFIQIEDQYGSTDNFLKAHQADFDIIRSNILLFITRINTLKQGTDRTLTSLLKSVDEDDLTSYRIKATKDHLVSALGKLEEDMTYFIKDEESAHSEVESATELLDNLSKDIRAVNFYESEKH